MAQPRRILLTPWGSLGDLHPYIAVGRGLRERGHHVTLATCEFYRAKVEGEGLHFARYSPDLTRFGGDPEVMRQAFDEKSGTEYIIRKMILPAIEESYQDMLTAARGMDLIVGHQIAYAVAPAAEKLGIPWISAVLQPMTMLSVYDPPLFPRMPWVYPLRHLGSTPYRLFYRLGKTMSASWIKPILELRSRHGIAAPAGHPMFEGSFSPLATLVWYSPVLGGPYPDWPAGSRITGFPFYDRLLPEDGMAPELARFLSEGEAPIVFTLGSSAVMAAGGFYRESARAAIQMKRRAVLLTGAGGVNQLGDLPPNIFAAEYAPYSELFAHAAAVVHPGGIGTTAQVMRSGRPMLVVPFAHDQPDNALRMEALGVGRSLARRKAQAANLARELDALLSPPDYRRRAEEIGRIVAAEDGVRGACDAIEDILT